MQKLYRTLSLCFMVLSVRYACAQMPLVRHPIYTNYTTENSQLSTGLIYKVVNDHNGYIWLVTDKGLIRFNGRTFSTINTGSQEDFVTCYKTRDDILWLMGYTGRTVAVNMKTQAIIHTDSLYKLHRITNSTPWLLAYQHGDTLELQKPGRLYHARVILGRHENSLIENTDFFTGLLQHFNIPEKENINAEELWNYFVPKGYAIQIRDSILIVKNKIFIRHKYQKASVLFDGEKYGLNDYILDYARVGNDLWIGALEGSGLLRYNNFFSGFTNSVDTILPHIPITSLAVDDMGNVWAGSYDQGLYLFRQSDLQTHFYKSSIQVSVIQQPLPDITAIGFANGLLELYMPGKEIEHMSRPVYSFPFPDAIRSVTYTGKEWLVFTGHAMYIAKPGNDMLPKQFLEIMNPTYKDGQYYDGVFYFVLSGYLYGFSDGTSKVIFHFSGLTNMLSIQPLRDDKFIIGSSSGVYLNETLLPYLQEIQVNKVRQFNGQVFFCTMNGTYRIPIAEVASGKGLIQLTKLPCYDIKLNDGLLYFRTEDGLQITDINKGTLVAEKSFRQYAIPFSISDFIINNKYIIVTGNKGVFYLPRNNVLHNIGQPVIGPQIHILNSLAGNLPADTSYTCQYNKKQTILFDLDILNYSGEGLDIDYRILKNDDPLYEWTRVQDNPLVSLHGPTPDRYTIVYHVRSPQEGWEKTVSYALTITPLWWQMLWVKILANLMIISLIGWILWLLYRKIKRQNYERFQQKLHLYELESKSIIAQLKPHFIFNVLTPLQNYLIKGDKIGGLVYLDNYSSLMRYMLNSIREKYTSLKDEITFLERYFEVQLNRSDKPFKYIIKADQRIDLANTFIPTLLLQPLAENALEHGISNSKNEMGKISIQISELENSIGVTIEDNGVGLPADFMIKENHALVIINERIVLLKKEYGTGDFKITNRPTGQGVSVLLVFPKQINITKNVS